MNALKLLDSYVCIHCGTLVSHEARDYPAGWHENLCDVCITTPERPAPARVRIPADADVRTLPVHLNPIDEILGAPAYSGTAEELAELSALWRTE